MKQILILILLVIIVRLPLEVWLESDKKEIMEYISQVYLEKIEPNCATVRLTALDGEDGFVYFDAVCISERKEKTNL